MLDALLEHERRLLRPVLVRAGLCGATVSTATILLLAVSGWFLTAAALAGLAGPVVAQTFNYMLPAAGIRLLAILRTGARYGERLTSHEAALRAMAHVRPKLFAALGAGPPAIALSYSVGDATARLVQDVGVVEARFARGSASWGAVAAATAGCAVALIAGVTVMLAVLGMIIVMLVVARLLADGLGHRAQDMQQAAAVLREMLGHCGDAAPELRCYGIVVHELERIEAQSRILADAQIAQARGLAWYELLQAAVTGLAGAIALVLAAPSGAAIAALAALAAAMAVEGIGPLVRDLAQQGAVEFATQRLDSVLASAGPVEDTTTPFRTPQCLSFPGLLHAMIPPGSRVAIVGPSGVGKTSLVETLIGLRPASPGHVQAGGIDLAYLPTGALRAQFAWAPQDAMLLAGSVRDNLVMGYPAALPADMWAALRCAALDERIVELGGLDTWIGDNGVRLSGGERRRLALARALLADAPWLLLDEPLEGVDPETCELIVARLAARLDDRGQGLLVVSHRQCLVDLCATRMRVGMARSDDGPARRGPPRRKRHATQRWT